MKVHSLMHNLSDKRLIKRAAKLCMNRNSCSGFDNISWKEYKKNLDLNLVDLQSSILNQTWELDKLQHKEIFTFSGKHFTFVIPSTKDRVLLRHLREIIEPILEKYAFSDFVSGYRKERSRLTSLKSSSFFLEDNKYVVSIDIRNVSSNISVEEVINLLAHYISDGTFLKFVKKVLSSLPEPIFPGSSLSPMLINLRLTPIDNELNTMKYIRFADNYCIFCETRFDAEVIFSKMAGILKKHNLEIAIKKSTILNNPNLEDLFLI